MAQKKTLINSIGFIFLKCVQLRKSLETAICIILVLKNTSYQVLISIAHIRPN